MGLAGRGKIVFVLFYLSVLLIYGNTFSVPFQFDDDTIIVDNQGIRALGNFLDFSGSRYVGLLTFALNYRFGGLNVFGYHLVNLLIHLANGFLVYWLVSLLFQTSPLTPLSLLRRGDGGEVSRRDWIALATALLFLIHPIQTQAVTYIAQRFASLVTLFYLLAVVGYLKWRLQSYIPPLPHPLPHPSTGSGQAPPPFLRLRSGQARGRGWWYLASLISCLLAMKTKENSFTIPLMIFLVEMIFFRVFTGARVAPSTSLPAGGGSAFGGNGPSGLVRWAALIPFFLMLPIIPWSRGDITGETDRFFRDSDLIGRFDYLVTQFRVIVIYLRLLVLPVNQSLDYAHPVYRSFFAPPVFFSFLFLSSLAGSAVYLLWRKGQKLVPFGLFWFFLTLAVESSIVPIKDVIVEHRLYLPSFGFFLIISLAASWAWERWRRLRIPFLISLFLIAGGLATATYRRNLVWQDKITLWQDVVEKFPRNPRGHYNLGSAYREKGMLEEAIQSYQEAIRLRPDYSEAWNNMGASYSRVGRFDEAMKAFQQASTLNPDNAEAWYNIASIYSAEGHLEESIPHYLKALELKPDHAKAHNNLGVVYASQRRLKEAVDEYRRALEIKPDYAETHNNLGVAYASQRRLKEAVDEFRKALEIQPDYNDAASNLEQIMRHPDRAK